MATLLGDNYTKAATPTSDNILSPGTLGGRVRVLTDTITLAAADIADVVKLGKDLQDGAIILGIEVYNAALGASTTGTVGDSDTADRYLTLADTSSAGWTKDLAVGGSQYKIGTNDGDNTILYTVGGAAATGVLKVDIYYTED